eukprot:scaffold5682_cov140-Cylindrotheca_fusiformis.AAC.16
MGIVYFTRRYFVNVQILPWHRNEAVKISQIVIDRKKKQRKGGMQTSAPKRKKAKVLKEEAVDPGLQMSGPEGVGSAVL